MKFARYKVGDQVVYGTLKGDVLSQINTSPFEEWEHTGDTNAVGEVKLLAPCTPEKVFYLGGNYTDHTTPEPPQYPMVYLKMPNAIVGPDDPIILPKGAERVEEEAELVVVMGKRCKSVSPESALDYVLGYTCGNDVSGRAWQEQDGGSFWRAKSSDTFAPIGPCIDTDLDPSAVDIFARVNRKRAQQCNTRDLIFDVPTSISFISQTVTLEPGDVIFTGTGGTTVGLNDGDIVEIGIRDIGTLSNPVKTE